MLSCKRQAASGKTLCGYAFDLQSFNLNWYFGIEIIFSHLAPKTVHINIGTSQTETKPQRGDISVVKEQIRN